MLKSIAVKTTVPRLASRLALGSATRLQARCISSSPTRRLEFPDLDQDKITKLMDNPLVQKLSKSPQTLEALKEISALLAEKGYSGEMGVMKQVKLMMDKEVRAKMLQVKELMEQEGIELRQEDMNGLFEVMGLNLGDKKDKDQ